MLPTYADAAAMVAALKPEEPVYCFRPHVLTEAARRFVAAFPGDVLYAVKCNPETVVLDALIQGGIKHFDTASLVEIETVKGRMGAAGCYFMHPVKQRGAIRAAYERHGVRHFVVDHPDELEKVTQETGGARDVVIVVRLATARGAAVYDLGGKFGTSVELGAELLKAADARGLRAGISFHVGSQCLMPSSYTAALRLASECLSQAGVTPAVLDVGGGFPTRYVGSEPPPLSEYMEAIRAGLEFIDRPADCKLWAEPGRGLVAAGASLVVKVELRRGDHLYVNDGLYGSLADLKFPGIVFPMRVIRPGGEATGEPAPMSLFGPTCDCWDNLPGPYMLPSDVREGDWIEIGQAGAYTTATRTNFNGFFAGRFVTVQDPAFEPESHMIAPPHARAA
ncbi:MAG TPA: type III PLP-dependent enzyme [Azospirillaceae bacterium]|nr:type III PLP-dependent enzyme [Azospirillaceae bacterium]